MRFLLLALILCFFLLDCEAKGKVRIKRPKSASKPKPTSEVCKTVCDNFDNHFDYTSEKCYGVKGESLPEKPTPEQQSCYCSDKSLFSAFQQCYDCRYVKENGSKEGVSEELQTLGRELNEDIALCNSQMNTTKNLTPVRLMTSKSKDNDALALYVPPFLTLLLLVPMMSYFLW